MSLRYTAVEWCAVVNGAFLVVVMQIMSLPGRGDAVFARVVAYECLIPEHYKTDMIVLGEEVFM